MDGYLERICGMKISETATAKDLLTVDSTNTTITDIVLKKAGAGELVVGILQEDCETANDHCLVVLMGPAIKVTADGSGASIVVGNRLKSDASAHAVQAATNLDEYFAVALSPCTADGDEIWAMLSNGTLANA